ncbi:hypothetical protein C3B44_07100 [Corynebacterium yudongzhengii]|uniref:Zf-HC2 domain-containing protein n=1 Tax=Corynebacterium yudongzhengii TaxID=2080740 RepID=A0A2U1T9U6_9CORY|nr:zf-HC2 domain-containing protein [Corynebacterium yudongzhengii]AWB82154.1 hypothetical protein C3B44_07100 [Corynebacterium yudongzhengii]PWC02658.1 zf-HC2 domain-containing protein [Corynebacterium yudongzhengii]
MRGHFGEKPKRRSVVDSVGALLGSTASRVSGGWNLGRLGRLGRRKRLKSRTQPREFSSIEHLSHEAVAAFVDDELSDNAAHRARVHVVQCPECRHEVHAQRRAAQILQGSNMSAQVRAPRELLNRLAGIADGPVADGPTAEATPTAQPEDVIDRVETFVRTFRRMHGHRPARGGRG